MIAPALTVRDTPGTWRQVASRDHPKGGPQVCLVPDDAEAAAYLASVSTLHTLLRWADDTTPEETPR